MTQKLENVKRLYLEGIRDGHARAAIEAYTGERYTQHSTGVRDGVEGFLEFFEPFLARNPVREIEIVRAVEDGTYVFVHAFQSLNGGEARWVTTDLFDTDGDDKIVEHWDTIAAFVDDTVSGRTQVDGPTEITDLDETDANKALVTEFLTEVLQNGRLDRITDFVSTETYHQHNPHAGDGLEAFQAFMTTLAEQGQAMVYRRIHRVIGQGNFVVSYGQVDLAGIEMAVFDIFRVHQGRIVEHWDNMEPVPPRSEWANSGKF